MDIIAQEMVSLTVLTLVESRNLVEMVERFVERSEELFSQGIPVIETSISCIFSKFLFDS